MQFLDVTLRRSASGVTVAPEISPFAIIGRLALVRRLPLIGRLPVFVCLVLVVQLIGGSFADQVRAFTPMLSTAASVAGAVSTGATTVSTAVTAAATTAAGSAREAIAAASHVEAAERDSALAVLDSARTTPAAAANPATVAHILDAALPAGVVAAWWTGLSASERADLTAAAPVLVGNLDGVPLDDRVEANRVTASRTLAAYPRTGSDLASAEASYLAKVSSGIASLYAFDVGRDSIVEIVGNPHTATRALVFTPGTTASLTDFYTGNIQSLASWEVGNAPASQSTVAFVSKLGSFPEWTVADGPLDNRRSIELGVTFHRFNSGLDSTIVGSLPRTSVEHSFGSSVGGVAEMLGTRFDTRIVLGGVGMVAGWLPSESTRYVAYVAGNDVTRYIYGLVNGDAVGYAVSPSAANSFEQKDPGLTADSWYLPLRLLAGAVGPAIEVIEGFINHNKVASASGNTSVLESIRSDIVLSAEPRVALRNGGEKPAPAPAAHVEALFLTPRESNPEL
ncbi:hypothetical protein ELQ92_05265 [Labedella populi]|uniref:Uncharacterized protein n=1 Tax=Labedella populi TaxID=2498850 RepID=A0A444QG97_9MICO|nr:hypothetical protein [Labedella populi]RWZ68612.1 hypothetical protein ELQ92_05265 [Labedella populi]